MFLNQFEASMVSFVTMTMLLTIFSIMDIRYRRVRNRDMLIGGSLGAIICIISGHMLSNSFLHMSACFFVLPISYILFRTGSIGGADAKVLWITSIISPGIEFVSWENPVLEGIVISGIEIVFMLLLGFIYWKISVQKTSPEDKRTPPLIPFLFVAYLLIQCLAFI